jgi:hypothetical protein
MTRTNAGLAAALLLAASCSRAGSQAPAPAPAQAVSAPSFSASDQEVLEFALADLASYSGEDSPVVVRRTVTTPLEVAPDSADWPLTIDEVLHRHDASYWTAFPPADEAALAQAAADLVSRTKSRGGFSGFRSRESRVKVADANAGPKERYEFPETRSIRVWPPGFSSDRRLAVVRMSIPWSIHHAEATYVLGKRQGNWALQVRQFVYYP